MIRISSSFVYRLAFVTAALCVSCEVSEGSSVSSGNSAGESLPAGETIVAHPLPPSPSGLVADRIDKGSVKLTWSGTFPPPPSGGGYDFVVFRAKNDEPWQAVAYTTATTWTDGNAEILKDFRYVVSMRHALLPGQPGFVVDAGAPCNEVIVHSSNALISAGVTSPFRHDPPSPWPDGYLTVEEFLPDVTGWIDGPTSFTLPGPFDLERQVTESTWEFYGEQAGWFPRGKALAASGLVHPKDLYRDPWLRLETEFASSNFVPLPESVQDTGGEYYIRLLGSQFAIYDGKITGDSHKGFDGKSNPISQMIPVAGTRSMQAGTFPKLPPAETFFTLSADAHLAFNPSEIAQDPVSVVTTDSGTEREMEMAIPATRSHMIFNVHKDRTLHIAVYYVSVREYLPGDTVGKIVSSRPTPINVHDFENKLNEILGEQVNVHFQVRNAPDLVEFHVGAGGAGVTIDDTFRSDRICDIMTLESKRFKDVAAADGDELSVFCWPPGYFGSNPNVPPAAPDPLAPPKAYYTGLVPDVPSIYAFLWSGTSFDTWVHEVGHMLNLQHSFFTGSGYSSAEVPDDPRARLMGYDRTDVRLIKAERDRVRDQAKVLLNQ